MKKIITTAFFLIIGSFFPFFSTNAQVDFSKTQMVDQEYAFERTSGLSAASSATETVSVVISIVLGFLALIFLILTVYAGFLWMTAAGDESKVAKARGILITAIIGLIIVITAYSITFFVFKSLNDSTYTLQ